MKKLLNKVQLIVILLLTITTYSQVNVSISNMSYISGTPISNCGTIAFGTNATVRIQFTINLSKQQNQVVGTSNLFVYTIGSSGSRIERSNTIIQPVNFVTNFQTSADITMSQTDFNNSGGTLFAVFKSSGNIEYQTACSYPITKTIPPSFTLSPTTLPLLCSDTSSRTFTVTPANIPSGAVVTYQWSHNGWSEISTTATSKTLQPNSGTTLPSSVTVTPFINGVSQGTRTCTVTRSDFTSSATISGSATICSSVTYTMSGLLTGQTVSSWTLSDPSKATLSATSGTTTTVTKIGIGQVTLTATISNACNQTVTKTLNLFIGASSPNAPAVPTVCVNLRDGNNYLLPASQGAASYQLISSSPNLRMNGTTNLTFTTAPYMINFRALVAGNYTVTIKTTNICGTTTATFPVNAQNCSTGGRNSASYAVYPNPASSVIYITYEQATGSEEGFMKASNSVTETETLTTQLYDFGGNLVRTVNFAKSGTIPSIDISDLKKGIYVLKIIAKELEETHRIIIE